MNSTVVLSGKRHSIPVCLVDVLDGIRSIDGVVRVGIGNYGNKGKYQQRLEWRPQTVDPSKKTVNISLRYQQFAQDIWVTLRDGNSLSRLASYLNGYES